MVNLSFETAVGKESLRGLGKSVSALKGDIFSDSYVVISTVIILDDGFSAEVRLHN